MFDTSKNARPVADRLAEATPRGGEHRAAEVKTGGTRALTVILVGFWLQPVILWNTGIPVASLFLSVYTGSFVALGILRGQRVVLPPTAGAVLVYIGLLWTVVLVISGHPANKLYEWATLAMVVTLGPTLLGPSSGLLAIRTAAEIGIAASSLAVVAQLYISPTLFGLLPSFGGNRVTALSYNANGGAFYLMMGVTILVGHLAYTERLTRRSYLDLALATVGIWSIWSTQSRGAFAGVMVAIAVALIVGRRPFSRSIRATLLGLVGGAIYVLKPPNRGEGTTGGFSRDVQFLDIGSARSQVWSRAIAEIQERPILGTPSFESGGLTNTHNLMLEVWLLYGLFGLVLFIAILLSLFGPFLRSVITVQSSRVLIAGTLMLACLTYSVTHVGLLNNSFFWLIVGSLTYWGKVEARRAASGGLR